MSQTIRKLFSRAAMMLLATILLTMTAQTAWAQLTMNGVKYIDANGVEQTRDGVIVLTGSETKLGVEGTENSPTETWYLCNTNLSYNSTLSSYDYCNVNIILADGVEMSVEPSSSSAIYILGSLGIYGQSTGTNRGALTAKGTSRGIWVNGSGNNVTISGAEVTATGDYAIYSSGGGVSITGSKVTATGTERGIFANGDDNGDVNLTIIGSEVTATATGTSGNAIFSWGGSISISDAEVTAEGNYAIYTLRGGVSITGGKVTANGTEYGIEASGSNKDITIKEVLRLRLRANMLSMPLMVASASLAAKSPPMEHLTLLEPGALTKISLSSSSVPKSRQPPMGALVMLSIPLEVASASLAAKSPPKEHLMA